MIINHTNVILKFHVKFSQSTKTLEFLLHIPKKTGGSTWNQPQNLPSLYLPFGNPHTFQAHDEKSTTFARRNKEQKIA